MIPRVIHQVWLGATGPEPPRPMARAAASWREFHPGWEYRLWSEADIRDLLAEARPDLTSVYLGYPRWVQRADAARYLILHEHGGVYADHDIQCLRPWDALLDADVVLAPTRPVGVSNDLMAARPRHPLFHSVLDALPTSARRWDRPWVVPYLRVMASTGPLLLSRHHRRDPTGVRLLTSDEYGHGHPDRALVRHLEGSSWHGWDGRALAAVRTILR